MKKVKCDLCDKTFTGKHMAQLYENKQLVHEAPKHECSLCGMKFGLKKRLILHLAQAHNSGKHKCPICNKVLAFESQLKFHLNQSHEKKRDHKCNECDNTCEAISNFIKQANMPEHQCSSCTKRICFEIQFKKPLANSP